MMTNLKIAIFSDIVRRTGDDSQIAVLLLIKGCLGYTKS